MSTTAITQLLKLAPCLCSDRTCIIYRAWAEVEAIQRAAKALDRWNRSGQQATDLAADRAWNVLESIAKEAP